MPWMHPPTVRAAAVAEVRAGRLRVEVARALRISPTTVSAWVTADAPECAVPVGRCFRCDPAPRQPVDHAAYAHLLGLYLGDGCLSRAPRTWVLRITCDDR